MLVAPALSQIALRLKVSRASIKRAVVRLRNSGFIELCYIKRQPTDKMSATFYKMVKSAPAQTATNCGS